MTPRETVGAEANRPGEASRLGEAIRSADASRPADHSVLEQLLVLSRDEALFAVARDYGARELLNILCVSDPEEALAAIAERGPDAAIVGLPIDEGERFAARLRASRGGQEIPLAFALENASAIERLRAIRAGAHFYLLPPVESEGFGDAARALLTMRSEEQPRLLIVDDDGTTTQLIASMVEPSGGIVRGVQDLQKILRALEELRPDFLLIDRVGDDGLSALDICRIHRASTQWRDLTIGVCGAADDRAPRIEAIRAGADDYLQRPFLKEEVLTLVRTRHARVKRLREKYDHDPLTGLLSRRAFVEAMRARLVEAGRHGRQMALALMDIDHFKSVNDLHGHPAGDAALSGLGKLLQRRFRAEDLRGRWGGEELILAFPGETPRSIEGALARLLAEYRAMVFRGEHGEVFSVSWSAGIAGFPEDGTNLESLIRAADRRLYRAKRLGRMRIEVTD